MAIEPLCQPRRRCFISFVHRQFLQKNESGSILLVMAIAAAGMVSAMTIMSMSNSNRLLLLRTQSSTMIDNGINSSLDLMISGLKYRKCFTINMLPLDYNDPAPNADGTYNSKKCPLIDDPSNLVLNTERILLTTDQVNHLSSIKKTDGTPLFTESQVKNMTVNVLETSVSLTTTVGGADGHPLANIFASMAELGFKKVTFRFERIYSKNNISSSAEAHVRISVKYELTDYIADEAVQKYLKLIKLDATNSIGGQADLIVYPRELNQFALILAGGLDLSPAPTGRYIWSASDLVKDTLKSNIPTVSETGSKGITIASPVYIYDDIILPSSSGTAKASINFQGRVYLGAGLLKSSEGSLFKPDEPGGQNSKNWSSIKNFTGFAGGLELDQPDAGLRYLFGMSTPGELKMSQFDLCRSRLMVKTDLTLTRDSQLFNTVQSTDSATGIHELGFHLGSLNEFVEQDIPVNNYIEYPGNQVSKSETEKADYAFFQPVVKNNGYRPVIRLRITTQGWPNPLLATNPSEVPPEDRTADPKNVRVVLSKYGFMSMQLGGGASLEITMIPKLIGATAQNNELIAKFAFKNQTKTTMGSQFKDINTLVNGVLDFSFNSAARLADISESGARRFNNFQFPGRISINFEAFDLAYSRGISKRTYVDFKNVTGKAMNELLADAYDCDESKRTTDSFEGDAFHCRMGPYKRVNMSFDFNSNNKQFVLAHDLASTNYGKWFSCETPGSPACVATELNKPGWGYNCFLSGKKYTAGCTDGSCCDTDFDTNLLPMNNFDYVKFDKECGITPSFATNDSLASSVGFSPSLAPAMWTERPITAGGGQGPYAENARFSWGYTEDDEAGSDTGKIQGYFAGKMKFDKTQSEKSTLKITQRNSLFDMSAAPPSIPTFNIRSIISDCIITADANVVAGFLTCESLVIEKRTTPLRMIGTFIVGRLSIHPDAIAKGVFWTSIHHPTAILELKAMQKLAGLIYDTASHKWITNGVCDNSKDYPVWHPFMPVAHAERLISCSPLSLRNLSVPMKWTTVDPDCGVSSDTQKKSTCLNRKNRYVVSEVIRKLSSDY